MVRTVVHGPPDKPNAAVTVMRAWERAWLLQHFVDVGTRFEGATGKLQFAYLDHILPRPDGRYLMFFVKTDNHGLNSYLRRFLASIGTPESASICEVELWSRSETPQPPPEEVIFDAEVSESGVREPAAVQIRPLALDDEIVVARAAERALGSAATSALSMRPGEFSLPATQEAFERADLERDRRCEVAWRGDKRVYALLEERSTPGLNLTWMLNATWVLPIQTWLDADGTTLSTALAQVIARPAQAPTGDRFLNVAAGVPSAPLEAAGFRREARVHLYSLNRAGVHRFHEYASRRYGELSAVAASRQKHE
jgi:hypothetical protein